MKGFWKAFKKRFFRVQEHRQPRGPALESQNPVTKLRSLVQILRGPGREPRSLGPAHGDSAFSSEPGASPPRTFNGDSAALSEPGTEDAQPSFDATKPGADNAKPNRDSRARGGSQERSWCCAGLRGFDAKTSRGSFGHRHLSLRTAKPKLSDRFWSKKWFRKVTF